MNTKNYLAILLLIGITGLYQSCDMNKKPPIVFPETDLSKTHFIPKPVKVVPTNDAFGLDQYTAIYTSANTTDLSEVGQFLADKIKNKTGLVLPVNESDSPGIDRMIYINQADNLGSQGPEAYQIVVSRDTILLNAASTEAAFRAVQTLRQMIPDASNDTLADRSIWPVPTGKINDYPVFEYRGSMLDVARHFFSVEDVKKYIDILAYYKINGSRARR